MKKGLFLFLICIPFLLKQQNCGNAGFESGTSSGWICKSGDYGSGTSPNYVTRLPTTGCINSDGVNAPGTAQNRHTIMGPGGGNDPNSINPLVPVVAPGNLFPSGVNVYSFRLGNDAADGTGGNPDLAQAESVRFLFTVDGQNAGFTYLYSAFLQDPNHSAEEQPRFEIKISEVINGVDQPTTCGYYKVVAGSQTATFHTGNDDYRYTDWTPVGLDLTGYIGKTIALEFITSDCFPRADPGSHSAYVYIDAYCQPMTIDAPILCANTTSAQLCAPPGYFGYTWPAGQLGVSGSPQTQCVTVNNPVAGTTYSVNITSVAGCLTSTTVTLKRFGFTVNDTTLCAGITPSFSLCATPTTPGNYNISWAPATGLSCTNCYCPVVTTPVSSPQTYTVTLTDPALGGCSETKTVTVKPLCAPTVSATGTAVCPGECAAISATGKNGTPPYTFTWSPGGLSGPGPHTVCPTNTTTYTVTLTDAGGNTFQDTAVVSLLNPPSVTASALAICPGGSSTLTASGAQSYTWTGGTIPATGSSVSASPPATTTYTVTGTSSQGCTNQDTVTVTVNPVPVITAGNLVICKDSTGILTASGGTGNYTWNPGNTVGPTRSVTPNALGTSSYTVSGANAQGCTNSTTLTVTANDCSKPTVTLSGGSICTGACFTLNASATGSPPLSYSWFPDPGNGAGPHTVCPGVTTTYTVIVSDNKGDSDTAWATVTVNPLPVITANNTAICSGTSAALTAGGGAGNSYTWMPSCGGAPLTGGSVTVSPANTCTYTVVGRDANGCINSALSTVSVNPLPVITTTGDTVCRGEQGSISASGASTYTWMPSGSAANPLPVSPSVTTTYTVTGTDHNACSNTAIAVFVIQSVPVITVSSSAVCAGKSATLSASGAASYTWLPLNATGTTLTAAPSVTTTYTITGASTAGCSNFTTASITVNVNPIAAFGPDTSGCVPLPVLFGNNSVGPLGSACLWNFGDGTPVSSQSCMPSHTYTKPGSYTVSLIIVTPEGCTDTLSIPDMIKVYPQPVAGFTASPPETDIMEPRIIFTNTSSGDSLRIWTFGDYTGDSSNISTVEHIYEDTGTYNVCLNVMNRYGCRDAICHTVIVRPVWSFFIPNAFTPNGDGKNDTFNGKGENIKDYELYIFDRWGNLVFESNSLHKSWNGIANNGSDIAQEDVYVYLVRFKDIFDKKHQYAGGVALVK